jgi:hypothetical protein
MSRAAIAAGADGVLIEVHHKPEEALSDGPQALLPEAFAEVVRQVDAIAQVLGRSLQPVAFDLRPRIDLLLREHAPGRIAPHRDDSRG